MQPITGPRDRTVARSLCTAQLRASVPDLREKGPQAGAAVAGGSTALHDADASRAIAVAAWADEAFWILLGDAPRPGRVRIPSHSPGDSVQSAIPHIGFCAYSTIQWKVNSIVGSGSGTTAATGVGREGLGPIHVKIPHPVPADAAAQMQPLYSERISLASTQDVSGFLRTHGPAHARCHHSSTTGLVSPGGASKMASSRWWWWWWCG